MSDTLTLKLVTATAKTGQEIEEKVKIQFNGVQLHRDIAAKTMHWVTDIM